MTCAILLDAYAGQQGPDQYAVTYSGSLADCEAQTHHDGGTTPIARRDYQAVDVEVKSLIGPSGEADAGRIVEMRPIHALAAVQKVRKRPPRATRSGRRTGRSAS